VTDRAAVALPGRALAGSVAGKGVEALTLAALVLLVPRALGPADYGGFAVALAVATGIATATGIGGPALFARVLGAGAALVLGAATAAPVLRGAGTGAQLPAGALQFARLQAVGGALTQVVHRGAAPACALAGVGAVATGHAAIATGAALAITYAVLQTMLVALPGAARAHARDPAAAELILRRAARWCAWAVLPACALLALAAAPLLAAALGEEFRDAADVLRIALAAAVLAPLWTLATQLAAVRGRPGPALAGIAATSLATFAALRVRA
jgi:O-antigen/teichoic acid export membrane protein